MNIFDSRKQKLRWLFYFLIWTAVLSTLVSYFYYSEVKSYTENLASEESLSVHFGNEVVIKNLQSVRSDVLLLAQETELFELPVAPTKSNLKGLRREFLLLSQIKGDYDQVRYINKDGQEVIRVNFDQGRSYLVAQEKLQNKADRYYFKKSTSLSKGEVYVSPFDLNIENEKIEKPIKPMLRIATPVFDKSGRRRGIVVLNYLGSKLLDDFREAVTHHHSSAVLLNNDGYWLSSPNPEQEWGFMFNNNVRFGNHFPDIWRAIEQSKSGQLSTERGFFTFKTVFPLEKKFSTDNTSIIKEQEDPYYWKIVSHIPQQQLEKDINQIVERLRLIFLPIFISVLLGFSLIIYYRLQHKNKELLLNRVMEHSLNEIYMFDNKTLFFSNVNRGAQKNIGYTMSEMLTMTPVDIKPEISTEEFEKILEPLRSGQSEKITFETVHKRKNGSLYPVEVHLQLMDQELRFFVAITLDITLRKQAQEESNQYAQIVSCSSDMMAFINKDFIYRAINTAYLKKLNKTSKQIIGKTVSDILGVEFFKTICEPYAKRCFQGETVTFETRVNLPAAENRLLSIVYSPYSDANNDIQGFVVSARDITEFEILRTSRLDSIGVLAGGIAHDFNNILTGLFGNIQLAKLKISKTHEAYQHIHASSQAMAQASSLTKQLLTFAKGGQPILELENIKFIIEDSVSLNLSGSNVKAELDLVENIWAVNVDKGQISQVISNLVINAIQAMPEGGSLYIGCGNVMDRDEIDGLGLTGDFIRLTIADEGIGIPENDLEKIFDPYFSTKHTGSGLGLSSAHSIISKHGGSITVNSIVDKGTTFTIYLPALTSTVKNTMAEMDLQLPVTEVDNFLDSSVRILVMDDEDMIRTLVTDMLDLLGCDNDTAVNGNEAIEKYQTALESGNAFDMVIMDLTIPGGMGGKEAVEKLLAIDPEAKVIVSSGYSTDSVMANYQEYGFKERLVKPFQLQALKKIISRLLVS